MEKCDFQFERTNNGKPQKRCRLVKKCEYADKEQCCVYYKELIKHNKNCIPETR